MEVLPKDVLFSIAIRLDLPELLKWCASGSIINDRVCGNVDIWNYKLKNEFPNYPLNLRQNTSKGIGNYSPKETYILLYKLYKIKKAFRTNTSLDKLYNLERLYIMRKGIREIPKEISVLKNLKALYLPYNMIKSISKEISKLNLEEISLHHNIIKELPKEIGDIKSLTFLDLDDNYLKELPKEIGNLTNLRELHLENNKLTTLPIELNKLKKLIEIDINGNDIIELPDELLDLPFREPYQEF